MFIYRKNFLVAAINLAVPVTISGFALILFLSYRTLIIWVFIIRTGCLWITSQREKVLESVWVRQPWMTLRLLNWLLRLVFDKVRKLLLKCCLHASTKLFLIWQQRPNFLNGCLVIFTSDNTMLMQETVISFEDVMRTKLKVRLCISRSSTQSLTIVKETCFSSKGFIL